MNVTFKLFATLMDYLPESATRNAVSLEVSSDTTPNQLIEQFKVPKREVHLVLVNGVYLDETGRDKPLQDNDTLAIWPPVAGG